MQKQKGNVFLEKFRILNSQEHNDDIHWSSSDSSDYENYSKSSNFNNSVQCLKRKRKRKTPNNISNLEITLIGSPKASKEVSNKKKSPILCKRIDHTTSPILPSQHNKRILKNSPILVTKTSKSPIIITKNMSPTCSAKVKKKLFKTSIKFEPSISEEEEKMNKTFDIKSESQKSVEEEIEIGGLTCRNENYDLNDISTTKGELTKKVRSFFDSHFSSENASQNSISDVATPKESSKSSENIEIFTCKTQVNSNDSSIQSINKNLSTNSSENSVYNFEKNCKKIRYRKEGLAYRLNNLLKKQNANVSLWHHEQFLAETSNFIIPKGEHLVFRIQKVNFKYGCYLLQAVDGDNKHFLLLVNSIYVSDSICNEGIVKIYEPYKILDFNDNSKLIVNICKYEYILRDNNTVPVL